MQDTEVLQTEAEENWRAASAGTRLLKSSEARRVGLACSIGTAIERYDFFIYGTAAAVVFAPQFFPQISDLMARLAVGGFAPVIAAALFGMAGTSWAITAYLVTLSFISWLCVLGLKETRQQTLAHQVEES